MENPCVNDTVEKPSVPPGFVSLTSFSLKRLRSNGDSCSPIYNGIGHHPKPASTDTSSHIIETPKYSKSPGDRPWILYNQSSHDAEEIDSERIMADLRPITSLPKGVIHCSDSLKVTANWQPEAAQIPVLAEAPVFYPTEEEFKDTLDYVANIRTQAERYGICRIVPPDSWKPPELLKEKKIWETERFSTYIQEVNELKNRYYKRKLDKITVNMKGKKRTLRMDMKYGSVGGCQADSDEVECSREGFEFKCGPEFTMETFKKYADHFKEHYFCKKHNALDAVVNKTVLPAQRTPSVKDIEGEYWRIVENPTAQIEVLCCADLDSRTFGSGFPLLSNPRETQDYLEYVESGWNLNNTAKLPGSLLAFENRDTSAVSIPQLHVGMCFSSLCWKVEKHHLYSLYYMHFGAPKIWYGIPWRYLFKFEAALKRLYPDLLEHPDLLYKLVTQLSLSALESEGIPVYRCVQLPGEFSLILPGAYYSVIDCGFNCSEAVNFAPFDWLPHGQNVVEMYSERSRKTSVSHDKLLLHAAIEAVKALWELTIKSKKNSAHILRWTSVCGKDGVLAKALKSRIRQEGWRREFLCNSSQFQEMEKDFDSTIKRECIICLYDLHLSAAGCPCSPGRYSCLQHAKQFCSCAWSDRFFHFRYKISELNVLVEALEGKSSALYKWAREKLGATVDFNVPKDVSPKASVPDKLFTSADNSEKAKHRGPQAHDASVHQISPSTVPLNKSSVVWALQAERAVSDPKISLKGKEGFMSTLLVNSQPHTKKGATVSKNPRNNSTVQTFAKNPITSLAQTPLSKISRNKQVAEKSSSPYQANVIVLSDDEE